MRAGVVLVLAAAMTVLAAAAEAVDLDALRARALELVNRARAEHRLPPLTPDPTTTGAAQAHADDMRSRRYYAHVSPDGITHHDRYVAAGGAGWRLVGENIARCSDCASSTKDLVERLHRGWMDSPGHRENILTRGFDRFGFGLAADRGEGLYAVQVFAGPGSPRGLEADEIADAAAPERQAELASERINGARRAGGRPVVRISAALSEAGRSALPEPRSSTFDLSSPLGISAALLPSVRRSWRAIQVVAGSCGGCGVLPTATDIRNFVDHWLGDPSLNAVLTGPEPTHLGFSMAADGTGRKIAVVVFAAAR